MSVPAFKAAPGCIVAYLMLLAPLAALGHKFINPNKPVVSCSLAHSAQLPSNCTDRVPGKSRYFIDPNVPVVSCRPEHSAQRSKDSST